MHAKSGYYTQLTHSIVMIMITVKQYQEHESYIHVHVATHSIHIMVHKIKFNGCWVQFPVAALGFFFSLFLLAYNNVDGMKDLWC